MNTLIELLQLRALALIVSSQQIELRRHIQEQCADTPALVLSLCREKIPKIDWDVALERAVSMIKQWQHNGMHIVSYFESDYPAALKVIEDSPLILFSRGQPLSIFSERYCLAIVGSRRCDADGLELAFEFASTLSKLGIVIVSGLALGVDGAAHRGALQSNLQAQTIAVLGSGLNVLYPPQHSTLAEQIIQSGGIVLSQFEPDIPPYPSNFLNRNRVVSGLSRAVLVVEATLRSGSLVTARNALDQGKDVLVIPGDINNPRFEGSNKLIQQGATLVTSVQDILDVLNLSKFIKPDKNTIVQNEGILPLASKIEMQIIENLENRKEMRVDELVRELGSVSFEKELLMLELRGVIQRLPGNILKLKRRVS